MESESLFGNRVQQMLVDGGKSKTQPSTIGIPQGNILVPILFAEFINDLAFELVGPQSTFIEYVVDTNLGWRCTN